MLVRLTINNIVLIEKLAIDFAAGFSALTGETGAGKSILLDSLGLAIGGRSETRLLRHGAEKANVSAEFDLPPNHPFYDQISAHDLDLDIEAGDAVILKRSINAQGRSRASINDQPISAKMLQILGAQLVEIHGQYDTHGLLDSASHRAILDSFAGLDGALQPLWQDFKQADEKLRALEDSTAQAKADEAYLRDAIEQLDALAPQQGEEDHLTQLRDSLMHRERVLEGLNGAYHALSEDHDPINSALGLISRIADKMPEEQSAPIIEALERASYEMEEARGLLQSASADLSEPEHNFESVDERLYALRREARKHQCTADELIEKRESLAEALNQIDHADERLAQQILQRDKLRKAYATKAQDISAARQEAAQKLDARVMAELEPLKLGKARFVTDIQPLSEDRWGAHGMDDIQFLVATNPGQAPGALGKIASGGEMSRFMLALKVVLAQSEAAKTLIFDEVDAGIGGSTADAVGQRLAALSAHHQVLVVTHAPQVAARAAHHYLVQKQVQDEQTISSITPLQDGAPRNEEIARMLAGDTITPEALSAAKALLRV